MVSSASEAPPAQPSINAFAIAVAAGVICGLLAIVQSTGFGMLLLVGETQSLAPTAIGMALASTAVMAAVAAFSSSVPGVVAIAQGVPIAALAVPVAAIIAATDGGASGNAVAATVVVSVALATAAIGVAAYLLGSFRLGQFIRFVPFPVIGGFLAGSGWLILFGGVGVVAGRSLGLTDLGALTDPETLLRFAGALAFLAAVALLGTRLPPSLALPAVTVVAIIIFNLATIVGGISSETLRADGWLIDVADGGALWPPVAPADLRLVDWSAMLGQVIHLPIIVILTVMAVLMNATGIELDTRRDVDLDRELRSVGLQNLLGGAAGGMPGYHSVSLTALSTRLGATHALVGIIVTGFCVAALVLGDVVLALVPTPLLGGLLIWIGLLLVIEWLVRSYGRLTIWEYLVIILIFAVIVAVGFAWGILVGLIATVILFVVEYGRVEIVRHLMTGRDYQSSNDTSEDRREVLRSAGDAILIVRLQGFLFFGTADRLRKRIQERIERHEGTPVRFVVVDFRRVSGLDSSTVVSFTRLAQMTGPAGFVLVLCGMTDAIKSILVRGGLGVGGGSVRFESDLDHGLEWSENALLAELAPEVINSAPVPVVDLIGEVVGNLALARALLPFLERVEVETDGRLIEQGAPSHDIYFVEQGRAAVEFEAAGEHTVRVATIGRGAIVGEVAFYRDRPRSASVIAEAPLVAWRFSSESLAQLAKDSPDTAIAFHRGMAAMLADRLAGTNELIHLLSD